MPAQKPEPKPDTRVTYRVNRAFVHDGKYFAGRDVPAIAALPPEAVKDRIARGYIEEFRAHGAAPATSAGE